MVNIIKLDQVNTNLKATKQPEPKAIQSSPDATQDGVTVTNHMNKLLDLVNYADAAPMQNKSLHDLKQSIQNNTYIINFDLLSDKLLNNGILPTISE